MCDWLIKLGLYSYINDTHVHVKYTYIFLLQEKNNILRTTLTFNSCRMQFACLKCTSNALTYRISCNWILKDIPCCSYCFRLVRSILVSETVQLPHHQYRLRLWPTVSLNGDVLMWSCPKARPSFILVWEDRRTFKTVGLVVKEAPRSDFECVLVFLTSSLIFGGICYYHFQRCLPAIVMVSTLFLNLFWHQLFNVLIRRKDW